MLLFFIALMLAITSKLQNLKVCLLTRNTAGLYFMPYYHVPIYTVQYISDVTKSPTIDLWYKIACFDFFSFSPISSGNNLFGDCWYRFLVWFLGFKNKTLPDYPDFGQHPLVRKTQTFDIHIIINPITTIVTWWHHYYCMIQAKKWLIKK